MQTLAIGILRGVSGMNWDLSVMHLPAPYRSVAEIPPDVQSLDLGPLDAIRTAVSAVFVGVDWSEPGRGLYRCPSGSIEFNIGAEEPAKDFTMRVRADLKVAPLIAELCRRNGWSALDSVGGELLPQPISPAAGLESWRTYEPLESPLGIAPPHEGYVQHEYQIGSRLVWVMCKSGVSESDCVKRANEMLSTAFEGIPAAIRLAEQTSRDRFPDIWTMHDWSGIVGHRLDVWGVRLTPDTGTISYDISRNWDFDFSSVDVDSNDMESHHICIDRSPDGALHVRNA